MKKYELLMKPHPNSRYRMGSMPMNRAELVCLLKKAGVEADVVCGNELGVDCLRFEAEALEDRALGLVSMHSQTYLLSERREDGSLMPLLGEKEAYLGADLPAVQKYKGKTNETFTMHLLNKAFLATGFDEREALEVLDPMCGRGTTLFQALNRGWNATGAEIHEAEIDECGKFFKKYLEFHKIKHKESKQSLTWKNRGVQMESFEFSGDPEAYRKGDVRRLALISCDSAQLGQIMKKKRYHLIAADLPYGVQHAPGTQGKKMAPFDEVMTERIAAWSQLLLRGGAMALSFNVHTLPTEAVRDMMERAGLHVMRGDGYDGLAHWVEQAITRDTAVAVKE